MIIFKPLPSMQSNSARSRTTLPNQTHQAVHRARFLRHQRCIASVRRAARRALEMSRASNNLAIPRRASERGWTRNDLATGDLRVYNFRRERSVIMPLQRMKSNLVRPRATRPNRAWWAALRARCLGHQGCEAAVKRAVLHAACFCHQRRAVSEGNFRRAGSAPMVRPHARRLTFLCNANMLLPWVEAFKETNLW